MKNKFYYKQCSAKILRVGILSALFLFLATGIGYAGLVKGRVTDAAGEALLGVTVMVKGSAVGTATDINGNYEISVSSQSAVLRFSYIGYVPKDEPVGNRTVINVLLQEDHNVLNEVVVVGYDTQRKVNLTGAVSTVDVAKQLDGRPLPDLGRGLQGAVPGLSITTSSGRIGTQPNIRIRGAVGTLIDEGNGASRPLILVDGVEISDITLINPDDVENISVLKDAASSSIYGTRAAFGVLLITTKKGSGVKDKFDVSYSNNFSWASPITLPKMAKSYENAQMLLDARDRQSPGTVQFYVAMAGTMVNAASIERMKEWERIFGGYNLGPEMVEGRDFEVIAGQVYFYRSWDAAKLYMREWTPTRQHNFSVNGTTGKTNVYLGLGYMGQSGVVKEKPDRFDRYSVNMNLDTKVNDWLTTRGKFMFSRTDLESPATLSNTANVNVYQSLYHLYRWPSWMPYGTYEGKPFRNPITEIMASPYNTGQKDMMRASVGATAKFTKDLSLDVDYTFIGENYMYILRGGEVGGWDFWGGSLMYNPNWALPAQNKIEQEFDKYDHHAANAVLRYNKPINRHKIGAFAGVNIEEKSTRWILGRKFNLLDFNKQEFPLAGLSGETPVVNGEFYDWSIFGTFARVNYSFADRYLLELNGRYDGSSKFPLDQLYGFFASASGGWIFTEEKFMESVSALSFGKLRVSYGEIGNQAVGLNQFRPTLANERSGWLMNDNEWTFGMPRALARGFTWENVETKNLGLDLRFFNNKLGFTCELYQRKTKGLISAGEKLPATFGASPPLANAGELTNNGWEIGLDFHHKFSNGVGLGITANLSDALTTVTKHSNGLNTTLDGSNYKGKIYGEIWGFDTYGFFTENDFAYDEDGDRIYYTWREDAEGNRYKEFGKTGLHSEMAPGVPSQEYVELAYAWFKTQPGDIRYVDRTGEGVINRGQYTAANPGDMRRIGNTTPRYEYSSRISLDYKGLDFSLFLQGVGKRDYWGTGTMMIPGWNFSELIYYAHQTDYWTPDNPNAFYPRLTPVDQPNVHTGAAALNFMPQTKYLLNMSYLRFKNVMLGYTLPTSLMKKAGIEKLRIYVNGENILTFHKLGKIPLDPETGVASGDGDLMGFGRIYPFTRAFSCGLQLKF